MNLKNKKLSLLIAGLGIAVFGLLPLCSYQVRTTEVAIVETFGKYRTVTEPGLKWKLPWPIQKVQKLDRSLQFLESKYEENYLADGKNLVLTMFAVWKIDDPARFRESLGSRDAAQRILTDMIRTEKGVVLARHPIDHLISTNPQQRQFEQIETEILDRVQTKAADKYGIHIEAVGIEQMLLPPKITKPVFERMASERRNKAGIIRQAGEYEATLIKADAKRKSDEIRNKARFEAAGIRSDGDEEAAKLYEEIQGEEGKQFAIFLRQLDALDEIMSRQTTLVIDRDVPPFNLLKGDMVDEKK